MRATLAMATVMALSVVSQASAAIVASDDFERTDSTNLGSTPVGGLTWTEYGGSEANTPTDVAEIISGGLVVNGTASSHVEIGSFGTDISLTFNLDFGTISATGGSTSAYRHAASVMIWRPEAADWGGSGGTGRSGGVVDLRLYPNGLMNLRTNDGTGSDYAQNIVYEENGSLSGDSSPHSPSDESATATQNRLINLTIIGSQLTVSVNGSAIFTETIGISPAAMNYISLGKDLITSNSDSTFDPRYDNVVVAEVPEPSSIVIIAFGMLFGTSIASRSRRKRG